MRWLPSISFSSSTGASSSSSSSSRSSPSKRSAEDISVRGSSAWRFVYRGKTSGHKKHRHHLVDREVVSSTSSAAPRLSESHFRSSSGYDKLPARLSTSAIPQPLPLPELSHVVRRKEVSASGASADVDQHLPSRMARPSRGTEEKAATAAVDISSTNAPIQSIFTIREKRLSGVTNLCETMPDSKIRQTNNKNPNRSSMDSFRLKVPVRSAPTSPFESPVLSPTRPSFDLLPYNIYMAPRGNQVWSSPEIPTGASTDPISTFSSEGSPATSPPGRNIRHLSRSPNNNGSSSPFLARSSVDNTSSRREMSASLEVHRLPLPPGAPSIHSPTPPALLFPELPMKSQWQKGKLIGRGTFGSVYVASNRETGALCAMKEVELFPDDPKSAECFKQLQQEIKVLSQLKHQNIVQYYGSEIMDDHFYIYLEYVHPGSINKYVRDHCGAITESVVRNFTRHILSGLAYLHSTKTIHRDIKGANLLVDSSGVVKLADFGMAKHLTGQAADLSLKGSPYWMAPELMQSVMQKDNNSDLALAVDIWSLGCTIIEMFTGKPPWSDYEGAAAMFKVLKDSPPIPETLSSEGKNFLQLCFRRNPAERPTALQLLDHRFLRNSQQLDCPTKAFTGLNLMEKSFSPNVQSPKSPSTQPFGGVFASESETRRYFRNDASEIAMGSRQSPRSTLETLSSVSPPHSARHNRLRLGRIDLTSDTRLFFPSENYTLC